MQLRADAVEGSTQGVPAMSIDDQARTFEANVAIHIGQHGPMLGVVETDTLRLDGHGELTLLAVGEGKVREISRQAHSRVRRGPRDKRATQPLFNSTADAFRQVPVREAHIGARKLSRQVNVPGSM